MDRRPMPQGEKPRSEPEIIPPDHAERRTAQGKPQTRVFIDAHGTERVYVAKLGPLGIILAILTTGILSTVMLKREVCLVVCAAIKVGSENRLRYPDEKRP